METSNSFFFLENVINIYEYLYKETYNEPQYRLSVSSSTQNTLQSFLLNCEKKYQSTSSLGVDFLCKYFLFQWKYWVVLDLENYDKKIHLNYIIGKKAFKRWVDRDREWDWIDNFLINNVPFSLGKLKKEIIFNSPDDIEKNRLYLYEENVKKKNLNTEKGFLNCIKYTTLFLSKSSNCVICKYSVDCKALQKKNFSSIYKYRNNNSVCKNCQTIS